MKYGIKKVAAKNKINKIKENNALHLIVKLFGTKVLMEDTIFTSPTGDGTGRGQCHEGVERREKTQSAVNLLGKK